MKEECLICKAPLEYLEEDVMMECALCHKKELSKARCVKGHYVCDECHSKGVADGYLVLYARKNRLQENRVGITVSKKLGGAVVRNRVRRRLREIYRLNEERFLPGYDIVVVARSRAVDATFQELSAAYLTAAEKAGILRPEAQQ